MTATFTTLCADHIDADVETFLDVFRVADHVHVEDVVLVETLNNMLRWNTNGRHEKLCTAVDDDADQVVQLAFRVVVAVAFRGQL